FLGIRRAIALQARLRQQREQAQREAEFRRKTRQNQKDDRRHAVARGIATAIAAVPDAEAQERLTIDLWDRLTEDERIDVDLADTALPIEALIASLCRALGLPAPGTPPAGGPATAAKSDDAGTGPKGERGTPDLVTGESSTGTGRLSRHGPGTTGRPAAPGRRPRPILLRPREDRSP
ncbi:MAG: hypothetical protein JF625_28845, partial [Inquilinus limosus]|nr:hypothetical protein [Inquilinus limosus]